VPRRRQNERWPIRTASGQVSWSRRRHGFPRQTSCWDHTPPYCRLNVFTKNSHLSAGIRAVGTIEKRVRAAASGDGSRDSIVRPRMLHRHFEILARRRIVRAEVSQEQDRPARHGSAGAVVS
jgi:hypothetical protein